MSHCGAQWAVGFWRLCSHGGGFFRSAHAAFLRMSLGSGHDITSSALSDKAPERLVFMHFVKPF